MDIYKLVEFVSFMRSELNVVKANFDVVSSVTFSNVTDSLTEITGEVKVYGES